MGTRTADRTWMLIGVAGALAILGLGWVLLLGPALSDLSAQQDQTAATEQELALQQTRLTRLRNDSGRLAEFQATLDRVRRELPAASGEPEFLRQLQSHYAAAGVKLVSLGAEDPVAAPNVPGTYAIPMELTVTGSASGVEKLVTLVQQSSDRAALVSSVVTSPGEKGSTQLVLRMQVFVTGAAT
ncbi:MAG TPA: type 4a pilus biogenesis protein PilO [Pilimelia sp.]|nr:type 4a pilus biogenesis protein PilO [Pilimelia sp.]